MPPFRYRVSSSPGARARPVPHRAAWPQPRPLLGYLHVDLQESAIDNQPLSFRGSHGLGTPRSPSLCAGHRPCGAPPAHKTWRCGHAGVRPPPAPLNKCPGVLRAQALTAKGTRTPAPGVHSPRIPSPHPGSRVQAPAGAGSRDFSPGCWLGPLGTRKNTPQAAATVIGL